MSELDLIIRRIKQLAEQHNTTINKTLADCCLNKSVIDNMKKGSMPSVDKLQKLADYFDVSVDYLLGRTDNPVLNK